MASPYAGKKNGPMRQGTHRLDLPDPHPSDSDNLKWLREMVERRRQEGIPEGGIVFEGEAPRLRSYGSA